MPQPSRSGKSVSSRAFAFRAYPVRRLRLIPSPDVSSEESLYPGLGSAENQGMDIMRAFVGIHHLEIHDMPNDAVLVRDAVAAQHVARHACDIQRLAAGIALHDGGDFHGGRAVILHTTEPQTPLQAQGDLRLHVDEFFLDELICGERPAELLAVKNVLASRVPAAVRRTERAPGNPVARGIEAGKRPFEPRDARK